MDRMVRLQKDMHLTAGDKESDPLSAPVNYSEV
jgi:hypothetical protein